MSEQLILKNSYRLGKKLKEDAIGILYEGFLMGSNLTISIREYHRQFCHPSIIEKMQDAILSTANFNHPNIVKIIDSVFLPQGRFFVIYDTPYEGSLSDILDKIGTFPEKEVIGFLNEVGKALDYAHQNRITHGAINPETIDVLANGEIKVRNFYIDDLLNSFVLTQGRSVLNLAYVAPEQLRGELTTKPTDVLALGVLAYQMLTGHKPYPEISSVAMQLKNYQKPPERLTMHNINIPKYLEDIVLKALQGKPQYRHQSVLEFMGDLRAKKVTITTEELKRREALAAQEQSANQPEYVNITPASEELDVPPMFSQTRRTIPKEIIRDRRVWPMTNDNQEQPLKTSVKPLLNPNNQKIIFYVLTGIFSGIILLIIHTMFISYFESVPKVEVPVVISMPADEAIRSLEQVGLRTKIAGFVTNSEITENCVVSTAPEGGRVVKKQRIVKIFVSKGATGQNIPDLKEREIRSVGAILAEKELTLNITSKVYSNKIPRGQIISQSPEAGQPAKKGETVNVVVSNGFPAWLTLIDKNEKSCVVKLSVGNEPDWEAQNVFVYIQDNTGRHKQFEKMLAPGEKKEMELVTDPEAIIEVYYFNDLAYKQELKYLEKN